MLSFVNMQQKDISHSIRASLYQITLISINKLIFGSLDIIHRLVVTDGSADDRDVQEENKKTHLPHLEAALLHSPVGLLE